MLLIISTVFLWMRGCSLSQTEKQNRSSCSEGTNRAIDCPADQQGRVLQTCKAGKWIDTSNDCSGGGGNCPETVFDRDIKPLIQQKCLSCHVGFDNFDVAKSKADEMIRRVNLAASDSQRMPKIPNAELSAEEKAKFGKWKANGLLKSCPGNNNNNNPYFELKDIEKVMQDDVEGFQKPDQLNIRWLVTSNKSNAGADVDTLKQFGRATAKSINSLSSVRALVVPEAVDQFKTIYRIDLRDYGLNKDDWNEIEAKDPVNFESFTSRGVLLKDLTGTKKPWMQVDSFAFTSNQAQVYYKIRDIPATEAAFFAFIGVNFNADIDNFQALFLGFADSPISLNKNRLVTRFDSRDGNLWATFDTDINNVDPKANLFNFPLLRAASGNNYLFNASEQIFSIPNGLHGYVLFNALGIRQDFAPLTVVADNVTPFNPEIRVSLSCYRCHSGGMIPNNDEIKASVLANASEFDLRDVDQVKQLYRDPAKDFASDNNDYQEALAKIGIAASDVDPVNLVSDELRKNQNIKDVAARVYILEDELKTCINSSAAAKAQIGTLLTGGSVTSQQMLATLPVLFKDCRLNQDPIE